MANIELAALSSITGKNNAYDLLELNLPTNTNAAIRTPKTATNIAININTATKNIAIDTATKNITIDTATKEVAMDAATKETAIGNADNAYNLLELSKPTDKKDVVIHTPKTDVNMDVNMDINVDNITIDNADIAVDDADLAIEAANLAINDANIAIDTAAADAPIAIDTSKTTTADDAEIAHIKEIIHFESKLGESKNPDDQWNASEKLILETKRKVQALRNKMKLEGDWGKVKLRMQDFRGSDPGAIKIKYKYGF